MKKSLFALAVLASFAGGAAAQSSVTVYGVLDLGLLHDKGGSAAGSVTKLGSGLQSGSRLGFRGSEDLGGGLSAKFVVENGFDADTGAAGQGGLLFGRQAYVGLEGGFGLVKLGRQNTPIFMDLINIDPFVTGLAGDISRLFATGGMRMNNTINYSTPNLSGFSGEFAYGFGEVGGNTSASRQIGLSLRYGNGPLALKLAHHNAQDATASNATKNTLLSGTYDFGAAKGHLAYALNKDDGTLDTRDVMAGVSVPVGVGTIMASYIRKSDRVNANADASQIALGYSHMLSQRTNLYASCARLSNDGAARYNVATAGANNTLFNVGIRHKF